MVSMKSKNFVMVLVDAAELVTSFINRRSAFFAASDTNDQNF